MCRASVNSYLHSLVHQDALWKRLFEIDSPTHLAVVLKNDWLLQKWRLWYPENPSPLIDNNNREVNMLVVCYPVIVI